MKLQATLEADLQFSLARLHIGQKDGQDFSQISFPEQGTMNNDCESTTITDRCADIMLLLNDEACCIHLEKEQDTWSGTLRMDKAGLNFAFTPVQCSDVPGFMPAHSEIPERNRSWLRAHSDYSDTPCPGCLEFELGDAPVLVALAERGIHAPGAHTFAVACDVMRQISTHYHHDGMNYTHDRVNRGTIAQMRHAEAQENYTNCRGMAIILAGALRAFGFRAGYVECRHSADDPELHVVCEVYAEDLGRFILLDPSHNLYYALDGAPLSLFELRQAICAGKEDAITINSDSSHNGETETPLVLLAYMSKNLAYLCRCIRSDEASEMTADNTLALCPRDLLAEEYPPMSRHTCSIREFYSVR